MAEPEPEPEPSESQAPQGSVPSIGRWLLLGTALFQAASPAFLHVEAAEDDPPFVPDGPFFSIWLAIIAGCIAVAIRGLSADRATSLPYRRIQIPLSFVHVGFVAWLVAENSPGRWVSLTLPIFVAMLAGLVVCLRALRSSPPGAIDRGSLALLEVVLGVYAGWSTAAIWLNVASLMPADVFKGNLGLALQIIVVGGAASSAAVGAYLLRGLPAYSYSIAAGWALVGVAISGFRQGALPAAITAGIGFFVVALAAIF